MTPRDTRDELERAKLIARTGSMSARRVHDVKRFMEIEKSIDAALALLRAPETQVKVMRCVVCKRNWCPDSYTEACPLCWLDALKKTAPETQERGWEDISTAPKDGTPVCLKYHVHTRGGEDIECRASFDGTEWCIEGGGVLAFHAPMGWRPIASPPAQTEDSK